MKPLHDAGMSASPPTADLKDRPVFIGGIPRSGTTLLRSMLDGHPQVVVHPGRTGFFKIFVPAASGKDTQQCIALAERTLLRYHYERRNHPSTQLEVDYDTLRWAFIDRLLATDLHLAAYLSSAILATAETTGRLTGRELCWAERTCFNELYTQQIFHWWTDAHLVQIIRDPRATYAARLRRHAPHNSVSAFAYSWLRSARKASDNASALSRGRFLKVRYEDLVQDTQKEMERIASFLDLEPDPILWRPTRISGTELWTGNSAYGDSFDGVQTTSVERWRKILSRSEVALLESLLRDEMPRHGYEPVTTPGTAAALRALPHRALNAVRQWKDRRSDPGSKGKVVRRPDRHGPRPA